MKILSLHCDYIKFKPLKKALKEPEELTKEQEKEKEIKEPLVILVAVEKSDETSKDIVNKLIKEITDISKQVGSKNIVLYPYAHLSSQLSSPKFAEQILKNAEEELRKQKFQVTRAPFGYYKEFELKCKGHPLAELSREIKGDEVTEKKKTQREEIMENIERKHYILTPEGKEYEIDLKDVKKLKEILKKIGNKDFETYILNNEIKSISQKEPPSIKEMQRQELVGYAPEADSGHFKFYPKGNLIFELLKDWAEEIAVNRFNALKIETPIIYDWSDKEIREQGGSFHERHYIVKGPDDPNKEWVLRFAGDFGLFKILKAANLTYKVLPLRIYEFSKSFRFEQKGELSGLRRLRGFHMPDIHSFTTDINSGWEEYEALYKKYDDLAKGTGVSYAIAFRIVEDFYKKNKDKIIKMLKYSKAPALIETLSGMKHYWAVKHEFQGLDSVNGSTQLSTVQLDVKDAETYGIVYRDKDDNKKGCTIVHSSVGSIERWLYCILEHALKTKSPQWPYWLSPTQIRLLPISDKFNKHATELAMEFSKNKIRAEVDDRAETSQKKIVDAEKDWVPFTIFVGEKEIKENNFALRKRGGGLEKISKKDLIEKLKKLQGDMPWRQLSVPILISKSPVFV